MINVDRLTVLVTFAQLGSVQATADELDISQPTVSHHLAKLAEETQATLVVKKGRNLQLTQEGQLLVSRGTVIVQELARLERDIAAVTRAEHGTIRIAAFPSAISQVVPLLMQAMPTFHFDIIDAEPEVARQLLERNEADIALTFRYPELNGDFPTTHQVLFQDPLYLVVAQENYRGIDLHAYADDTWLLGCPQCSAHMHAVLHRVGLHPATGYGSDDYVAVQSLIAAGLGVSLLPALALEAFTHASVTTKKLPGMVRDICVETLPEHLVSAPVNRVWEELCHNDIVRNCLPSGAHES